MTFFTAVCDGDYTCEPASCLVAPKGPRSHEERSGENSRSTSPNGNSLPCEGSKSAAISLPERCSAKRPSTSSYPMVRATQVTPTTNNVRASRAGTQPMQANVTRRMIREPVNTPTSHAKSSPNQIDSTLTYHSPSKVSADINRTHKPTDLNQYA